MQKAPLAHVLREIGEHFSLPFLQPPGHPLWQSTECPAGALLAAGPDGNRQPGGQRSLLSFTLTDGLLSFPHGSCTCHSRGSWARPYSPPAPCQELTCRQCHHAGLYTHPAHPKANPSCPRILHLAKKLILLCFRSRVIQNPKYRCHAQFNFLVRSLLKFVGQEVGLEKQHSLSTWMLWNISQWMGCFNDALRCWHFHPWNNFLSTESCRNYVYSFHYPVILFSDLKHPTAGTCLTSSCAWCWQAQSSSSSPIPFGTVCLPSVAKYDGTDTHILFSKMKRAVSLEVSY